MSLYYMENKTKKIEAIEIMKFFAALLITNSHFDIMYAKMPALATGGAIGNVLFFFCSGYTLMLSNSVNNRFDQFYKRRINRIYPSVIAWTLIGAIIFKTNVEYHSWGGWFVPCIMLYYVVLYLCNHYLKNQPFVWLAISLTICLSWYYFTSKTIGFYIFENKLSWGFYFFSFWLGSFVSYKRKELKEHSILDILMAIVLITMYFALNYIVKRYNLLDFQWIIFVPLAIFPYYAFKIFKRPTFTKCYYSRYSGKMIRIVSGLCLEIFLVQLPLITDKINFLFPLNLIVVFTLIVFVAYVIRSIGRLGAQTFNDNKGYSYKQVFKLY